MNGPGPAVRGKGNPVVFSGTPEGRTARGGMSDWVANALQGLDPRAAAALSSPQIEPRSFGAWQSVGWPASCGGHLAGRIVKVIEGDIRRHAGDHARLERERGWDSPNCRPLTRPAIVDRGLVADRSTIADGEPPDWRLEGFPLLETGGVEVAPLRVGKSVVRMLLRNAHSRRPRVTVIERATDARLDQLLRMTRGGAALAPVSEPSYTIAPATAAGTADAGTTDFRLWFEAAGDPPDGMVRFGTPSRTTDPMKARAFVEIDAAWDDRVTATVAWTGLVHPVPAAPWIGGDGGRWHVWARYRTVAADGPTLLPTHAELLLARLAVLERYALRQGYASGYHTADPGRLHDLARLARLEVKSAPGGIDGSLALLRAFVQTASTWSRLEVADAA